MKIGSVENTTPTRLASMAGITSAPFHLTAELMDAAALLMNTPLANAIAASYPEERPPAVQRLGKDPASSCARPSASARTSWT